MPSNIPPTRSAPSARSSCCRNSTTPTSSSCTRSSAQKTTRTSTSSSSSWRPTSTTPLGTAPSTQTEDPQGRAQQVHSVPARQGAQVLALRRDHPPRPQALQPAPQQRLHHEDLRLRTRPLPHRRQVQPGRHLDRGSRHQMVQSALSTPWLALLRQVGRYLEHGMHLGRDSHRKAYLSRHIDPQSTVKDSCLHRKALKARS